MEIGWVGHLNLVKVSSILPANCQIISAHEGSKKFKEGELAFSVYGISQTQEPHQRVTVALSALIPKNPALAGYISEIEDVTGMSSKQASDEVDKMALK